MTRKTAVRCFLRVVFQIDTFKSLVTDRAAAYLGMEMSSFCELFDITKISSTSYLPCSNAKVERLQKNLDRLPQGHLY